MSKKPLFILRAFPTFGFANHINHRTTRRPAPVPAPVPVPSLFRPCSVPVPSLFRPVETRHATSLQQQPQKQQPQKQTPTKNRVITIYTHSKNNVTNSIAITQTNRRFSMGQRGLYSMFYFSGMIFN